jgi:aminopeptidase N
MYCTVYVFIHQGACVLHMLRHYLTDQVFQSGIVRYLRRYSYSNAHNQDLWDSLANVRRSFKLYIFYYKLGGSSPEC